jgi:AraC-like DNA-binding protein
VRYFALLASHLRAQGVDTARLLRIGGINPSLLERFDGTFHPSELERLIFAARELTGRTDLGFETGRLAHFTSHGILGYGMLSCQTPDQVFQLTSRYFHLINGLFGMRCRRTSDRYEVIYSPVAAVRPEFLHHIQEAIATAHEKSFRMMMGPRLLPYDIYLSMPPPPHLHRYAELTPVRFHFDERALPGVRVIASAALMNTPLPMPSPQVVREVEARCEELSRRPTPEAGGWGEYVTMMLRGSAGQISLEQIAASLRVSARTVVRHLEKEKLQFRDLSQEVRFERACQMLASGGATVSQVAERLGFSNAANFSRSFRRFVGVSPSRYLQQEPNRGTALTHVDAALIGEAAQA